MIMAIVYQIFHSHLIMSHYHVQLCSRVNTLFGHGIYNYLIKTHNNQNQMLVINSIKDVKTQYNYLVKKLNNYVKHLAIWEDACNWQG